MGMRIDFVESGPSNVIDAWIAEPEETLAVPHVGDYVEIRGAAFRVESLVWSHTRGETLVRARIERT